MRQVIFALCVTAMASEARAQPAVPSPSDLYGTLFTDVQSSRLFPDSKLFPDAVARRAPEDILRDYMDVRPLSRTALLSFVTDNFDLPGENGPLPAVAAPSTLKVHIAKQWENLTRPPVPAATRSSALALPEPFVVPGGRFRELYYWDSYFTMLGLYQDGKDALAEAMLHDFEYLVETYGRVPNGTRSYYLTRSQPPVLALMVDLRRPQAPAEMSRAVAALRREHDFWMAGQACAVKYKPCARVVVMPDGSLLNRYWDDRDTPRDESFAEDVDTAAQTTRAAPKVYRDLRAAAESGWDFSSRWLKNTRDLSSVRTTEIVPVDLNSLLWKQETVISELCETLSDLVCADTYQRLARARKASINRYLWRPSQERYADYVETKGRPTLITSAAMLFPLFVGLADEKQAASTAELTRLQLTAQGGVRTTQNPSGQQWDSPNGWAPLQWVAVKGLSDYGFDAQAHDLASRWVATVDRVYHETGKILEKYDVEQKKPGGGGEYPLQDGFGWTNGVTAALMTKYGDLAR